MPGFAILLKSRPARSSPELVTVSTDDQHRAERRDPTGHPGAFADVPYPGDDAITLPPHNYRTERLEANVKGLNWRDVPLERLKDNTWLHLFSPAARRFYLPAYLLMELDRLGDTSVTPRVLFTLDPPEDMGWFEREYGDYTPAQKQAIRRFLEYVRDNAADLHYTRPTAEDALERYWAPEPGAPPPHKAEPARKSEVKRAIWEPSRMRSTPATAA